MLNPVVEAGNPVEEGPAARGPLTFKSSYVSAALTVLAFVAGILVGYLIWGGQTAQPGLYDIETKGRPSLGPDNAPVVIVEFSDYQCPYCAKWYSEVFKPLLEAYPGKIRFVYRNYPLSNHQNATAAAEAALCAWDQDAYWEFHNKLFESASLLNNAQGTTLDQATYSQFARELGLDVKPFEKCMQDHKYEQLILDDVNYANSLPRDLSGEPAVGGTPTFFINGQRLGGAYPIEEFKRIIDAELAK